MPETTLTRLNLKDPIEFRVATVLSELCDRELSYFCREHNLVIDLDFDSLEMSLLLVDVEDEFDIKIEDDTVEDRLTIGDWLDYLKERRAELGLPAPELGFPEPGFID